MKILVTGASGYIGYGVVHQLLKDDVEVIATDLKQTEKCGDYLFKPANIFEIDDPYVFYGKPDAIIHLAWRDGFEHNAISHLEDIHKHYNFLSKLIDSGIKKVCILGSAHEIGYYEGCIDEKTVPNPQSLYGISKDALRRAIEIKVKEKRTDLQWIRAYYIVGNVEHGSSVFSKIYQAEKRGDKLFPFTWGKNEFDFIDYNELCRQIAATAEQDRINGIINCCSGAPEQIGKRVEQFIRDEGYSIRLEYGKFPDRPYDSKTFWGDNTKIKEILKRYDNNLGKKNEANFNN